jgi:hypothetical protein
MRRCKCGFLVDADIDDEICPSCGGVIDLHKVLKDYDEECPVCSDVCKCETEEEDEDFYYSGEDLVGDEDDEEDTDDDLDDDEEYIDEDDDYED